MSAEQGIIESLIRRVEKLEQEWRVAERRKDGGLVFMQSRMTELADAMNEAGLAVGDHSRHAQMEERLKELERSNLGNYAYLMDVGGKLGWVIDQGFAMAIQEAIPKGAPALKADKPLVDPTIIETQAKRTLRLSDRRVGDDYALLFDPDASPSGVPFEVALMYLKVGRKVRLCYWSRAFLKVEGNIIKFFRGYDDHSEPMSFPNTPLMGAMNALMCSDWVVIPKEEKA
jgi:hypothetical protein